VKKFVLKSRGWPALAICAAIALAGCQKPKTETAAELTAPGYIAAPVIQAVAQPSSGTVVVTGRAMPDGRVRFLYGQARAVGVTADGQGRFTAELPISDAGGIYDLSMEDSGQLHYAEGRLFVPAGQPGKAVLLRPGAPAIPISSSAMGIGTVDYDSKGALGVFGRVAPRAAVNLVVNGEIRAQPGADAAGRYSAVTEIASPSDTPVSVALAVDAAGAEWKRTISVSAPAGDQEAITRIDGGWRVDWHIPAGGTQTTLVF
jgi:hypothetical protein